MTTDAERRDSYIDEAVLLGMSLAAIQLLQDYRAEITDYIQRFDAGQLSAGQFRSRVSKLIDGTAQDVYANALSSKLTPADKALIRQWVKNQTPHLRSFVDDKKSNTVIDVPNRAALWVASMGALSTIAFMRGHGELLGTWYYGATEQHCDTCRMLHDQEHPLSYYYDNGYIPQQPGSETLSCRGWKCQCEVRTADGTVLLPLDRRPV